MGLFGRKKKNEQRASDLDDKYESLHSLEQYEEAIACYDEATRLDPDEDRWFDKCNVLVAQEKNEEVFGRCSNHNWHGHNFTLYVTVKGIPNPDTGFVINLKDLSQFDSCWSLPKQQSPCLYRVGIAAVSRWFNFLLCGC